MPLGSFLAYLRHAKTATGGGKPSSPDQASKFIGTLQYMAPEVIIARGDDFDASDSSQVSCEKLGIQGEVEKP